MKGFIDVYYQVKTVLEAFNGNGLAYKIFCILYILFASVSVSMMIYIILIVLTEMNQETNIKREFIITFITSFITVVMLQACYLLDNTGIVNKEKLNGK